MLSSVVIKTKVKPTPLKKENRPFVAGDLQACLLVLILESELGLQVVNSAAKPINGAEIQLLYLCSSSFFDECNGTGDIIQILSEGRWELGHNFKLCPFLPVSSELCSY
jgi:hypothetical protein